MTQPRVGSTLVHFQHTYTLVHFVRKRIGLRIEFFILILDFFMFLVINSVTVFNSLSESTRIVAFGGKIIDNLLDIANLDFACTQIWSIARVSQVLDRR